MAWNNIEPYVRATGAPVRVGVVKIKTGNARACVSIGRGLFNDLGKPGRCNVFAGDGDEAGQVMLQFDEDGVHELTLNNKGGGASHPYGHRQSAAAAPQAGGRALRADGWRGRSQATDHLAALVT